MFLPWSPVFFKSCQLIKLRYEKADVLQLRLGEGK